MASGHIDWLRSLGKYNMNIIIRRDGMHRIEWDIDGEEFATQTRKGFNRMVELAVEMSIDWMENPAYVHIRDKS